MTAIRGSGSGASAGPATRRATRPPDSPAAAVSVAVPEVAVFPAASVVLAAAEADGLGEALAGRAARPSCVVAPETVQIT